LINAVNALRASHGLALYSISPILMATAQAHADYMAATGNVSHIGSGGSTVTERLLAAGYPLAGDLSLGGFRSENITAGNETKTAQDAVNGWTGDTLHLTTMISPGLTEIGAGVSVNGGRVYYVIDCALPTTYSPPLPAAETAIGTESTVVPVGAVPIAVTLVTPNADGDIVHDVQAGQTLWQIAISYGTKIDELKRLNNLYDDNIYPGDKLLIRKGATDSTNTPVTANTVETAGTATNSPTSTATFAVSTATVAVTAAPMSISTSRVMSVAIGIITLALLAGIFFIGMNDPRQTKRKTKEKP
jgi:LysM repeat protein